MLLVDRRWRGTHGIARFAQEVVARLPLTFTDLRGPSDALSPLDLLNPYRLRLRPGDTLYTPGFNAGLTVARQVLTLHDLIHLDDPHERSTAKRLYYDRIVRPAVRRARVVLTVSPTSQRVVRSWIADDRVDVVDVGNGCAEVFFSSAEIPPPSPNAFAYVGNLKPHKNPRVAFEAIARLPDATLTVVTHDADAARALAAEAGITSRTRVVSGCTDAELRDIYAGSVALLLPSLSEGFGLPAVEAIAVGRPVVHWAGCEPVSYIVGAHGIAVDDAHDAEAWAAALQRLATGSTSSVRPDGWRARYSWDAVAGRVADVLRSA
jgi:glycosyltransferase involved in cell wall biosynthesis